ncbi:MAG: PIN domain-containing protein [Methyloceanibacter sp.]|nr:PIN domain-containing protein [Methyloceanibacter sp.]
MSIFVDSSVWFAAAAARDHDNSRAKSILESTREHVTTDHVLIETWLLLNSRYRREVAELFWHQLRSGAVAIEPVTSADLEAAWAMGEAFKDQRFSIVDRTSFAVMERLGIGQAASFDNDFVIYRYGRNRERAFEVVRIGHSEAFRKFHRAILERQQITCMYSGQRREICPHILGHKDGAEAALVFQFGGKSSRGLPRKGEWRCLRLSHVEDVEMREGAWHSGGDHRKTQRCVDEIFIDVNTSVPNQPGRR